MKVPSLVPLLVSWRWTTLACVSVAAFLGCFVRVGADWDWLVALGDHVRETGAVPDRVPYAEADTAGWRNVPVLAELVASTLHSWGARSAVVAHLVLVIVTLVVLASGARLRGAGDGAVALAVTALSLGSLTTLVIVRGQTLSLVPFALMVVLVCSQARRPDRHVWWAVPLVAVWGNLHGAALLGVCVLGAYLLLDRLARDVWQSIAVGVSSVLALGANPQLWRTPTYYAEVFSNVSAQRAEGLWARPSLTMPFDVLMLVAAALLLAVFLRSRRRVWEYVACVGLLLATASAARNGVWLLALLVVLSARTEAAPSTIRPIRTHLAAVGLVSAALSLCVALPLTLARGDAVLGAPPAVVEKVGDLAQDGTVLAPAPLAEALAVAGVRVWVTNPLDAFDHDDQAAYLDFLDGAAGAGPGMAAADVVVVQEGSAPERLVEGQPGFSARPCGGSWICYVRD